MGICWDFGHANLMGIDQREALRVMGKRLKATHVADNSGKLDDHILPFQGNVNWRSILPVLSEIGYEGDLTFEIHNSTSRRSVRTGRPLSAGSGERQNSQ